MKADGPHNYEYVLLYTDATLVISENAEKVLRPEIGKYFVLKEESIGEPNIYLVGTMRKVQYENGVEAWPFGSSYYVHATVDNVKTWLNKDKNKHWEDLPKKARLPLQSGYRPELDVSPELNTCNVKYITF